MSSSHDHYDDAVLRDILTRVGRIAVLGASANPWRPSYGVLQQLRQRGYRVFGVNPGLAPDAIPGTTTVPTLAALPEPVDMVDVFRNSAAAVAAVDAVLAMRPRPGVIWMQLGVRVGDAVAARAEASGVTVIMDRCPAIEIARLLGPDWRVSDHRPGA